MVVLAIVAIGVAVVSLALRDPTRDRLERDATRLATLLEMARAESRATAWPVQWALVRDGGPELRFRFVGLSATGESSGGLRADRFLDPQVQVRLLAAGAETSALRLGPEAVLVPQRVLMSLANERLEVASDGVQAFAITSTAASAPTP
jgi:general secretion pathway protein H